jgi:hypothetical protein
LDVEQDRDIGDAKKRSEREAEALTADRRFNLRGTPYVTRIGYRRDSYEEL